MLFCNIIFFDSTTQMSIPYNYSIAWVNASGSALTSATGLASGTTVAYPKVTVTGNSGILNTNINVYVSDASGNILTIMTDPSNNRDYWYRPSGSNVFARSSADVSNNIAITMGAGTYSARTIYFTAQSRGLNSGQPVKATFAYNVGAYDLKLYRDSIGRSILEQYGSATSISANQNIGIWPSITTTGVTGANTDVTMYISDASGNAVTSGTQGKLYDASPYADYDTVDVSNNSGKRFTAQTNTTRTLYMSAKSKGDTTRVVTLQINVSAYPDSMTDIASTSAANTIYEFGDFGYTDPSGNALSGKITFPANGTSFTIFTDITPVNNGISWNLTDGSGMVTNSDNKILRGSTSTVGARSSVTLTVTNDVSGTFYLTAIPVGGNGLRKSLMIIPAAGVNSVGPITNDQGRAQYYDATDASNVVGLKVGNYMQLLAPVIPTTSAQGVDWTSSAPSYVTVNASGEIHAVAAGYATITATSKSTDASGNKQSATYRVRAMTEVLPVVLADITASDASGVRAPVLQSDNTYAVMVAVNETVTLSSLVTPSYADNSGVTWTSDDLFGDITLDAATGVLTGNIPGTYNITATAAGNTSLTKTLKVVVYQNVPVSSIIELDINNMQSYYVDASGYYLVKPSSVIFISGGNTNQDASNKNVNWTLSDTTLGSLLYAQNNGGNTLTLNATEGILTVTATADGNSLYTHSRTFRILNYTDVSGVSDISCATIAPVLDASATALAGQDIYVTHIPNSTYVQLEAYVIPEDAYITGVNWSGNSSYFSSLGLPAAENSGVNIDASGRIYGDANASGYYVVTALARDGSGKSSSPFYVYIEAAAGPGIIQVSSITVTTEGNATSITRPGTLQAYASVLPLNATNQAVTWSSSDDTIATVDASGLITIVSSGYVDIRATAQDGSAIYGYTTIQCIVDVSGLAAFRIDISGDSTPYYPSKDASGRYVFSVEQGKYFFLNISVEPTDATNNNISFSGTSYKASTGNAYVVDGPNTNNSNGRKLLYADGFSYVTYNTNPDTGLQDPAFGVLDDGNATYYAQSVANQSFSETIIFTVTSAAPTIVNPSSVSVAAAGNVNYVVVGETLQLTETVAPSNATDKSVSWSTSNSSFATVDASGLVTAVAEGQVTITATTTDGGLTGSITLNIVTNYVQIIDVAVQRNREPPYRVGETLQMSYTYLPVDATDTRVTWSSTNTAVATVDQNGFVTFTDIGSAVISATSVNDPIRGQGSYPLYVYGASDVIPTGLEVSSAGNATSLEVAATLALTATFTPADTTNQAVTWSSSNESLATIDASGVVTGVSTGSVTFTATSVTDSTIADTITLTVTPSVINATSVSVTGSTNAMTVGGATQTLTATVSPADASNKAVTWSSDASGVASVDASGVVTAVANGFANIYATTVDGGHQSNAYAITVTTPATSVSVTGSTNAMTVGGATLALTATVSPASASNKAVTWSTDASGVASVDASGVVTAVANGSVNIYATTVDGGHRSSGYAITVTTPATSVSVTGSTNAMTVGGATLALTATVSPAGASNKAVTWSSDASGVASVDASGVVTAVANGSVNIYATTVDGGHQSSAYAITVTTPVSGVTVTSAGGATSLNKNATLQLTATVAPAGASNKAVTWSSSNSLVARVDASGVVTGDADGSVTITATSVADGTKSGSITLTVVVPVSGITVTSAGGVSSITTGSTLQLTATVAPADASNKAYTWTSGNASIASVDASGIVTGVSAGTITIRATSVADSSKYGSFSITITSSVVAVTGVTVTSAGGATSLNKNATLQLTATVAPGNATNKVVTWSTSASGVATVSNTGLVEGIAAGSVTITATSQADGTKFGSIALTVVVPVSSVTVTAPVLTVQANSTLQLTATVDPADASNKGITWSTSAAGIAMVNSSGLVTGVAAGTVTITATSQADGTKSDSKTITVTATNVAVTLSDITYDVSSCVYSGAENGITDASAGIYASITDNSGNSFILLNASVTGGNKELLWSVPIGSGALIANAGSSEPTEKVKVWFASSARSNVTITVRPAADQTQSTTFVLKPMVRNTTLSISSNTMTISKGSTTISTSLVSPTIFTALATLDTASTRKIVNWTTDVSGIISLDVSGADTRNVSIQGLAAGTVRLTARANDRASAAQTITITVTIIGTVTNITRQDGSANSVTIYPGSPVVIYVDRSPSSTKVDKPSWSSSDGKILTATSLANDPANPSRIRATITAASVPADNNATITFSANAGALTKTQTFNVFIPVNQISSIELSQSIAYIGDTINASCSLVAPLNATDRTLRWFVYEGGSVNLPAQGTATTKATMNESTGVMSCNEEGTVTIFAVANDVPNIAALTTRDSGKKYNKIVMSIIPPIPGLTIHTEDPSGVRKTIVRYNSSNLLVKHTLTPEPSEPYTIRYTSMTPKVISVDASGVISVLRGVVNAPGKVRVEILGSNGNVMEFRDSKGQLTKLSKETSVTARIAVTALSTDNSLYGRASRAGPNVTPASGPIYTLPASVKVGKPGTQLSVAVLSDASTNSSISANNKGPSGTPTVQGVSWSTGSQPSPPLISAASQSAGLKPTRLRNLTTAERAANPNGIPVILTATSYDGQYTTTVTVNVM